MESYPKVLESDANLILQSFQNNINKLEFLTIKRTSCDDDVQKIVDLKTQLSWLRSKLTHIKTWTEKGNDKKEDEDINYLETKVTESKAKVKIREKAITMHRDTCLFRSYFEFQYVCEDDYLLQIWERQMRKLLTYVSQLANLHKAIVYHSKRKDESVRAFIMAKSEYIKTFNNYESVLKSRCEAIEEAEDNEALANTMLQEKIKHKYKQVKALRHLIQGLVGLAWITKPKKQQTVKKLLRIAFEMDPLPPLHNY